MAGQMPQSVPDTRVRLLDAAEQLFAENGFHGTSLRAITTTAGANLAAVNYHFGTKTGLIDAVFQRRVEPLNRERLHLLEQVTSAAAPDPPALEEVLGALIAPVLQLRANGRHGEHTLRLLGRMFSEPGEIKLGVGEQFRETAMRFAAVLGRILPELDKEELMWRMHFLIGSMAHTAASGELIGYFSKGRCNPDDVDGTIRRLTTFAAAGFRSASAASTPIASGATRGDTT